MILLEHKIITATYSGVTRAYPVGLNVGPGKTKIWNFSSVINRQRAVLVLRLKKNCPFIYDCDLDLVND